LAALIGQRRAETLLARAIAADRIGHAYLFLGPPSCGKATAALLFATAIACSRQPAAVRSEGDEAWHLAPCGTCESCRRVAAGTHPEVMRVVPGTKGGQNIGVDQARDIRKNAALRPKIGRRRVYVIPNAEALNEESANALLKTLEEPSESVTIILCAPNPSQVLPTVRSRCQIIRFGLSSPHEIIEELVRRGTDAPLADRLARASGGLPGVALTWSEDPSVLDQRNRVLDLFAQAVRAQPKAARDPVTGIVCLQLAEQLRSLVSSVKERDDDTPARPAKVQHRENLETGLTLLRDLLLLTEGASPELAQNQERVPELLELAENTAPQRVLTDLHTVREAQELLDRNVGAQLALERMFWALIDQPLPLPEGLFAEACP
jgi:DNA polymerase III subunit delta'